MTAAKEARSGDGSLHEISIRMATVRRRHDRKKRGRGINPRHPRVEQWGASQKEEIKMQKQLVALSTAALIVVYGATAAPAQGPMTGQPAQPQTQQAPGASDRGGGYGRWHMLRGGFTGGPGMTHNPIMMRMIFALMDTDGDGAISLQEFQNAHERIFKAMDSNKDGRLTLEELETFMHGTATPAPTPPAR